jgi:hypothetical protein
VYGLVLTGFMAFGVCLSVCLLLGAWCFVCVCVCACGVEVCRCQEPICDGHGRPLLFQVIIIKPAFSVVSTWPNIMSFQHDPHTFREKHGRCSIPEDVTRPTFLIRLAVIYLCGGSASAI